MWVRFVYVVYDIDLNLNIMLTYDSKLNANFFFKLSGLFDD